MSKYSKSLVTDESDEGNFLKAMTTFIQIWQPWMGTGGPKLDAASCTTSSAQTHSNKRRHFINCCYQDGARRPQPLDGAGLQSARPVWCGHTRGTLRRQLGECQLGECQSLSSFVTTVCTLTLKILEDFPWYGILYIAKNFRQGPIFQHFKEIISQKVSQRKKQKVSRGRWKNWVS